jgi:signal transduction histidine kinase
MIDERDLKIISAICNWAGIAIENTNFHHDARRMAVLEERDRIGMDLHDGIIQDIYGVGLMLDHARLDIHSDPNRSAGQIQTAINGLNRTIRDIRSYILDLKPRELGEENLLDGLKRLVMEYKVNTLADAVLKGQAKELANLPQKHALALFLICQEALANIAKHAHAKRVDLNVWTSPERVMLEIQDNGLGFDVEKSSQTLGHGLSNMHTRAKNVGGDLEITSVLHEGTSIFAWVPRGKA